MAVAKIIIAMILILGIVFVLTHLTPSNQVSSSPQTIETKELSNFTYLIYQFHITSNSTSDISYPISLDHAGKVNITITSVMPIHIILYNNSKVVINEYGSYLKYSFYSNKNLTFRFLGDYIDVRVTILLS
ncbi:MAG: hypothetical protein QXV69_02775 [Sulfolobaceae archaeon]